MAIPRKPKDNASVGKSRQQGKYTDRISFYDGYLDASDRKWIEDNYSGVTTAIFDLVEYADKQGYAGISCKYNEKDGKWLAILFGGDTPETGKGCALTARASTSAFSLFVLYYKACHKFSGTWHSAGGDGDQLDFS